MSKRKGVLFFAASEIIIGGLTLAATSFSLLLGISSKPSNVLVFVITSSFISLFLGVGILLRLKYARKFLLFFSGWVILSKVFLFMGLITLNGAMETAIAPSIKNIISIAYHSLLIVYFLRPSVRSEFTR
jgi:uncharacterized protein YybS (DUF2232 family)